MTLPAIAGLLAAPPGLCATLEGGDPCVPCSLFRADNAQLHALLITRRRVRRREALYRKGDPFQAVYALVSRTLGALQQQGVIEIDGRHVRLCDPAMLAGTGPQARLH